MSASFVESFKEDFPVLVVFLRKLGASALDAEEIAQEAYSRAYPKWNDIAYPRAWARVVARRIYWHSIVDSPRADPLDDEGICDTLDPADYVTQRDYVLAALQLLPIRQREVLAWSTDGFSPKEIAEGLGIKPEAVRSALKRGRENLMTILQGWTSGGSSDGLR